MTPLEWHGCPFCHLHAGVNLLIDLPDSRAKCPQCGWEGQVWQTSGRSEEAMILRRMIMDHLRASKFDRIWRRSYENRRTLHSVLVSIYRRHVTDRTERYVRES